MQKSHRLMMVAAVALAAVMALGTGLALAQSGDGGQGAPATEAWGPGGHGPEGPDGVGSRGRLRGLMVGGEVTAVDGDTITLKTLRGNERSVTVNDETIYRKEGGEASLSDVTPGEKVGIKLVARPEEGENGVAEVVFIGRPDHQRPKPTVGEVTAVDGDTVTIATGDGEQQFTIPSIEVGSRLGVAADEDGNVKALMYDPPERPPAPDGEGGDMVE